MQYRVKVTEKHSDYVWVEADSAEEAKRLAPEEAQCEFECLYDCEVVGAETSNVQIEAPSRPLAKVASNAGLGVSPGEEQDGNV